MDPAIVMLASEAAKIAARSFVQNQAVSVGELAAQWLATAKENKVQSEAKKAFHSRIQDIQSTEKGFEELIVGQKDLHKLSEHLVFEIRRVAEEAVTLDDQTLINDVFDFYRRGIKSLLSSTPEKSLSYSQLATIRTEMGLIRLKVEWNYARQAALAKQQEQEEKNALARLQTKADNEKQLQKV